jgi:phosphoserine phosphatase RsbU/P
MMDDQTTSVNRSATNTAIGPVTLAHMADALVGVESSRMLLAHLEELLTNIHALPARLWLFDGDAQVFFNPVAFGCERTDEERSLDDVVIDLYPRFYGMKSHSEWVAALEIMSGQPYDRMTIEQLCALLAPTLVSIHRHEGVVQQLREVREEVTQLLSAGQLLRHLDIDVLLAKILETVQSAVRAEVASVLTIDDKNILQPRVTLGLREEHVAAIKRKADGRSVAEFVQAQGLPLCLNAEQVENELDLSGLDAHLSGILALPLTTRDRIQGVVLVANPAGEFGAAQKRLAETVCSLAAIALDNALLVKSTVDRERLQRDLDLAQSIQKQMYPKSIDDNKSWHVDGMSRPCDETGGDYYSFLKRRGHLLAMIGDVSGHGLGAALYTTMAHAVVQQQLRTGIAIDPAFEALNEALFHTQSGRFMTAAVVDINPELQFTYVSAGHNPVLWLHKGEIRWLESCGMPLGIVPMGAFPPPPLQQLAPGDYIVLYTDGFIEAINPSEECYGEERLGKLVQACAAQQLSPADMMREIVNAVDAFVDGRPHEDDLTMVVVQITQGM